MSRSSSVVIEFPESVEEAGALLGATITKCGKEHLPVSPTPEGMHSAFAMVQPAVPSAELLTRLHTLRAFLRTQPQDKPLIAAPSLLAVLMKLLGVSTAIAAKTGQHASKRQSESNATCSFDTAPMLSNPLRKLWVECITLCHRLASGLSGTARVDTTQFVRQMSALAVTNPRSARAAGGVRIAALDVIAGLFEEPKLQSQLAPWSLEILQLCLRALRSAGNGEPTYRVSAMRVACATASACRASFLKTRNLTGNSALILQGAMEDKALVESVKVLKQAVLDKFPEVRSTAAHFAALLAPLLILSSTSDHQNAMSSLDDVMALALKNIDDESPFVMECWAEALARCISTAIAFNEQAKASRMGRRGVDADGETTEPEVPEATRFGGRKTLTLSQTCSGLAPAMTILVDNFLKAGGELSASRAGGQFSMGGRAVRVGLSIALTRLLRLQSVLGAIGEDSSVTMKKAFQLVLDMLGDEMEKQLKLPISPNSASSSGGQFFGSGRNRSKADPSLARSAVCRVIRQGLCEGASEPTQLAILHDIVALILSNKDTTQDNAESKESQQRLNANQLQCLVVELSHLISALGEAAASAVEDMASCLNFCLSHRDHGVRHEAALACSALTTCFPSEGRRLVKSALAEIQAHHAELVTLIAMNQDKSNEQGSGLRMFRRSNKETQQQADTTLPHQFAIHGQSLMVSVVIMQLPHLAGGLPRDLLTTCLSVSEMLVSFQFNEVLSGANPGAVCLCVRSGFGIIAGVLSTGPSPGVISEMGLVFGAWQKSCMAAKKGGKNFALRHDLFCLDAVIASIVSFLKNCSELLLTLPDALSQICLLLEESLELFMPNGRFSALAITPPILSRLESVKASLLESFAWLPSGSFPMAAENVFDLSAKEIQFAIETEVSCSILDSLVNKEDALLDAKTMSRVRQEGQCGGSRDLETTVLSLTAEAVGHGEREAVIHLVSNCDLEVLDGDCQSYLESTILGAFAGGTKVNKAPTPLHEVGSWRRPMDPSCSSKVRLVDAAIQSFAATFGMKSGKEQQAAIDMMESLIPPLLAQLARTLGMNASLTLTEQDRRSKAKEDSAAAANITALLLSCLQALPLHESTHNVPIGLGPQWMNKAKDLLLTLLPSTSTIVRRAAAEGLALLATLGVSEDGHFLQSSVLHSLDEVMQGNKPDGKPRTLALESISAARSGSLLTLASIQRAAHKVAERQVTKARERAASTGEEEVIDPNKDDELPILQMMARILPSVSFHGFFRDFFVVRTNALHSFATMLSYSGRLEPPFSDVDMQLLRKGIELIEGNFSAAWTAASTDADKGQEAEKIASEAAFLSVLLRLMTYVVPLLHHIVSENPEVARRFSLMATLILEDYSNHPTVSVEAMGLFEVLTAHRHLLPPPSRHVNYDENPILSCIPFIAGSPLRPDIYTQSDMGHAFFPASRTSRATTRIAKVLTLSGIQVARLSSMKTVSLLLASLEVASASHHFTGASLLRSLAVSREHEQFFTESIVLEKEIFGVLSSMLSLEEAFPECDSLRWLLFARSVLSGSPGSIETDGETTDVVYSRENIVKRASSRAAEDSSAIFDCSNVPRWQVKVVASHLAAGALGLIEVKASKENDSPELNTDFDLRAATKFVAKACREAESASGPIPSSRVVFHLEDLVSTACMSSSATLDHAELRALQGFSVLFLARIIKSFAKIPDPEQPEVNILDQYSTQIFSAVKHALSAPEESDYSEYSVRLFGAGCIALESIIEASLTTDPVVLKRLIRPVIPGSQELPLLSPVGENSPLSDSDNKKGDSTDVDCRVALLAKIFRLSTVARIFSRRHMDGKMDAPLKKVIKELIPRESDIAVNGAALAIDASSFLYGAKLSLVGMQLDEDDDRRMSSPTSGMLFGNVSDVPDETKGCMARAWASCASYAMRPLLAELSSEEIDEERRERFLSWVKVLSLLLFSGIHDADEALSEEAKDKEGTFWAVDLDATEVKVDCLNGVRILMKMCPPNVLDSNLSDKIEYALDSVIMPVLIQALGSREDSVHPGANDRAVMEACEFLLDLAASDGVGLSSNSSLWVCLLVPLNMLQNGEVDVSRDAGSGTVLKVIAACMSATATLIKKEQAPDTIVHAMVQLVLKSILGRQSDGGTKSSQQAIPPIIIQHSEELLSSCLSHSAVGAQEKEKIACALAEDGNWEAWSAVAMSKDGESIHRSLVVVSDNLRGTAGPETSTDSELSTSQCRLDTLSCIRSLLQNVTTTSPLVSRVLSVVGADVLGILREYGANEGGMNFPDAQLHRKSACADAMKALLVGYQNVLSSEIDSEHKDDAGENVAAFLQVLFETLIVVLRYNGLPNHPTPNADGDSSLGRMSAQAIYNIARTSPLPFKTCVSRLNEVDKQLLEYSVRAEMSGYAAQNTAAAPKKLNRLAK